MAIKGSMSSDLTVSVQDFIALRPSDEITYYNYSILEYLNGFDMFITIFSMIIKMNLMILQ